MLQQLPKRVLTAIVCIFIVFLAIWEGKYFLTLLLTLITLIGIKEYFGLVAKIREAKHRSFMPILYPLAIIILWGTFLGIHIMQKSCLYHLFFVALFFLALESLLLQEGKEFLWVAGENFYGLIYLPFLIAHLILLRLTPLAASLDNVQIIWFVLIITWVTDSGAYFVGSTLGRRPLSSISPKKTWEGAVGGVLCGFLAAVILAHLFDLSQQSFLPLGLIMAVAGQIGDLFESALKRNADIKDTGNLFPGHGGVMDRIDSLLVNIPLAYYYVLIFA